MSELVESIRREFTANDTVRDAGLTTPQDIVRFDDLVYGHGKLDLYKPVSGQSEKLPAIISVHGGAWVYGDKERYQYYCMNLAQRGFGVINFTYRLAPEARFPAQLEDTAEVFRWFDQNADRYGLDRNGLFAVGDSAGATILALYCDLLTNPGYTPHPGIVHGPLPKAVAFNCGSFQNSPERKTRTILEVLPEGSPETDYRLISPIDHVTSAFPPCFLMTCSGDFLQRQSLLMAEKLAECKVPFELHFYGTAQSILPHVFHCNIRTRDAEICNSEEAEWFMKHYRRT